MTMLHGLQHTIVLYTMTMSYLVLFITTGRLSVHGVLSRSFSLSEVVAVLHGFLVRDIKFLEYGPGGHLRRRRSYNCEQFAVSRI